MIVHSKDIQLNAEAILEPHLEVHTTLLQQSLNQFEGCNACRQTMQSMVKLSTHLGAVLASKSNDVK